MIRFILGLMIVMGCVGGPFRVRSDAQPLARGEIVCPASDEGGKRRQCIQCRACYGADRPGKASVAIVVHGRAARHFQQA